MTTDLKDQIIEQLLKRIGELEARALVPPPAQQVWVQHMHCTCPICMPDKPRIGWPADLTPNVTWQTSGGTGGSVSIDSAGNLVIHS